MRVFRNHLKKVHKPKNDVEAVIRYLLDDAIKLSPAQDQLCTRLMWADKLQRDRTKSRTEIIDDIKEKFGVTEYRAEQDYYDAQKVFGETRKLSKNYLLSHQIEKLQLLAQKCEDEKDFEMAARFMAALNNAIEMLPADDHKKEPPPTHLTFVFNGPAPIDQKPIDQVLKDAESLLKDGEYIDYEEDPTEPASDDGSDGAGR